MIPIHKIEDEHFTALASGYGGPEAIEELWRAQESRSRLFLRFILSAWIGSKHDRDIAISTLVEAERRAPAAVRYLLTDPMFGAWAAKAVRHLENSSTGVNGTGEAQRANLPTQVLLGRLGAVAAVAAIRAGVDADLHSYGWNGQLGLPTYGRARLPALDGARVTLQVRSGRLWIDGVSLEALGDGWQPLRRLIVPTSPAATVTLDDIDPYRGAYHVAADDRLSDEQVNRWQTAFAEGWQVLATYLPTRERELAAGLRCLVPLTKPDQRSARSATSVDAVGAVGLDLPGSAADFAVSLVHEFQHSKLAAITSVVALHDNSTEENFFAPWRNDPRPINGLFHGVYAFYAVADLWRALNADPERFPQAAWHFAEARAQVTDAVATLAESGLLTMAGRRFLDHLREAVAGLHETTLAPAVVAQARTRLEALRARWRQTAGQRR